MPPKKLLSNEDNVMKRLWTKLTAFLSVADVVVLIENGEARAVRGKVRTVLLEELSHLAGDEGIDMASIRAGKDAMGHRLSFSGIPEPLRQRFRNVWEASWR